MSFRDSVTGPDSSTQDQSRFHPFRQLIDNIFQADKDEAAKSGRNRLAGELLSDSRHPGAGQTQNSGRPDSEFAGSLIDKAVENSHAVTDKSAGERLLPDTIAVKKFDGSTIQLPGNKSLSADDRLSRYLHSLGRQVQELDLSGSSISDRGLALVSLAPDLKKLSLNDTDITDQSLKVLAQQNMQKLEDLNIHSSRVSDQGIAYLKEMPLKVLDISDTATSADCIQQIKAIKNLQVLYADYSGIGNESIKFIKDMSALRSLSLKGCPLTDDCIKDLSGCRNLMLLNLEDTKLSPHKIRWLKRQLPRCLIIPPQGE